MIQCFLREVIKSKVNGRIVHIFSGMHQNNNYYDNLHFFTFYESEYALYYFRLPRVELWVLFLQLRRYVDCGDSWRS